jgi:hypothetical protein
VPHEYIHAGHPPRARARGGLQPHRADDHGRDRRDPDGNRPAKLPQLRDPGQLVSATNGLSATQANMERYFQDNRTYLAANGFTPPCTTASALRHFTVSCPNVTHRDHFPASGR